MESEYEADRAAVTPGLKRVSVFQAPQKEH